MRTILTGWAALLAAAVIFAAPPAAAQQASLVVNQSSVAATQYTNTDWSLTKVVDRVEGNVVYFKVDAVKGETSAAKLIFAGTLTVQNSGSGEAELGNIVLNIQQRGRLNGKNEWISAAAALTDTTAGDAATSANIVAAGSQEKVNGFNYTVASGVGTFAQTSALNRLTFADAETGDAWTLSANPTLAGGASVKLVYTLELDADALALAAGTDLRVEALATFAGAGTRGGSGASLPAADVDGDGADETNVRTVASRSSAKVPALVARNASVALTDGALDPTGLTTGLTSSGLTVVGADFAGYDLDGGVSISESTSFEVAVEVANITDGASVTNLVSLTGDPALVLSVPDGSDELGNPLYIDLELVPQLHLTANATHVFSVEDDYPFHAAYRTYSQGGYGQDAGTNEPGQLLSAYWSGDVVIGHADGYTLTFTSPAAVRAFLPAGGKAGALSASATDPTSSSAGVFGGQVLTLSLNVQLSGAGAEFPAGFGDLVLRDLDASLDGLSVAEFVDLANIALSGGALPGSLSIADLNGIADALNHAFHEGALASDWALAHLSEPGA